MLISQLINCISRALQKILRSLNGTIISATFVPSFPFSPVIFCLNLNETLLLFLLLAEKSMIFLLLSNTGSSLYYCHELPNVFE